MVKKQGLVIWDLNGTLVDDLHISHKATCAVIQSLRPVQLASRGLPTLHEYRELLKGEIIAMYHKYGVPEFVNLNDTDSIRCHRYHNSGYVPALRDHAHQALQGLQDSGIQQAIVSSEGKHTFAHIMGVVGFRIKHMISPRDWFGGCCPKDEQVLQLAQLHDVPMQKVVYIGDTASDVEMARRVGALSIGLVHETAYGLESHVIEARPSAMISDMRRAVIQARMLLFG